MERISKNVTHRIIAILLIVVVCLCGCASEASVHDMSYAFVNDSTHPASEHLSSKADTFSHDLCVISQEYKSFLFQELIIFLNYPP